MSAGPPEPPLPPPGPPELEPQLNQQKDPNPKSISGKLTSTSGMLTFKSKLHIRWFTRNFATGEFRIAPRPGKSRFASSPPRLKAWWQSKSSRLSPVQISKCSSRYLRVGESGGNGKRLMTISSGLSPVNFTKSVRMVWQSTTGGPIITLMAGAAGSNFIHWPTYASPTHLGTLPISVWANAAGAAIKARMNATP